MCRVPHYCAGAQARQGIALPPSHMAECHSKCLDQFLGIELSRFGVAKQSDRFGVGLIRNLNVFGLNRYSDICCASS
jgi:hypothetical protein